MARGPAVKVMGIWLRRIGDDIVVSAETIYGADVELIREHVDGSFSHNISEHGIAQRFNADYWTSQEAKAAAYREQRLNEEANREPSDG